MVSHQSHILLFLWDGVVSIVARLWAGRSGVRIPVGTRDSYRLKTFTPLGSTQPPIDWAWEALSQGHSDRDVC
jgi:hypothetical protein